jgi:hypothetical protein
LNCHDGQDIATRSKHKRWRLPLNTVALRLNRELGRHEKNELYQF